jgi:tellurite resistance protein
LHASVSPRRNREPVIVRRTGPRTLDGIIAAAAAVAAADGDQQADERRSLLHFLRCNGLMGVLGRGKILERFRAELDGAGIEDISVRLRHLAGTDGARLVLGAALSVAAADGVIVPAERAVLRRLQTGLGLPSAERMPA